MAKKADHVYKTKWWRLVRPDHLKGKEHDAEWKAYKAMHGNSKNALGHHIFGDPPGTGALQKAANNKGMRVDDNAHHINWNGHELTGKKVANAIKGIRGAGEFGNAASMKHRADLMKKTGKMMKPSEARKHLMAQHYQVNYGPDGRAS